MTIQTAYPVMESFLTLQGEGFHTGMPAFFVRIGGCDVGCVWCDVKESWEASKHPVTETNEIIRSAVNYPVRNAVVTGGEPLLHNLDYLCSELKNTGFSTHLETSGAYPLSGRWDWICVSPKKFKSPLKPVLEQAHELKVVIYNNSDFEWAEEHAKNVNKACKLYLQPEWSRLAEVSPMIVRYIQEHPQWKLSLQTHKYLNIP
jgi:organic radical activating enzyme